MEVETAAALEVTGFIDGLIARLTGLASLEVVGLDAVTTLDCVVAGGLIADGGLIAVDDGLIADTGLGAASLLVLGLGIVEDMATGSSDTN